jgi:hypothetical protein
VLPVLHASAPSRLYSAANKSSCSGAPTSGSILAIASVIACENLLRCFRRSPALISARSLFFFNDVTGADAAPCRRR